MRTNPGRSRSRTTRGGQGPTQGIKSKAKQHPRVSGSKPGVELKDHPRERDRARETNRERELSERERKREIGREGETHDGQWFTLLKPRHPRESERRSPPAPMPLGPPAGPWGYPQAFGLTPRRLGLPPGLWAYPQASGCGSSSTWAAIPYPPLRPQAVSITSVHSDQPSQFWLKKILVDTELASFMVVRDVCSDIH